MDFAEKTATDHTLSHDQRQERINRFLLESGDEGTRMALDAIASPASEMQAAHAAHYLAGSPGFGDEKNTAMSELLSRKPEWMIAIASLVESANERVLDHLVERTLDDPAAPGAVGIAYELAQHFPERMRDHRKLLERYGLFELLLPGAPDSWVKVLIRNYRRDGNGRWVVWLSYVRTDSARQALIDLLEAAPSSRKEFLAVLLESSGVFADSGGASTYEEAYRGFVVDPSKSPHSLGGDPAGAVPISRIDKRSAERILEFKRSALPFAVGGTGDPAFFWFEGSYPPRSICVQQTKDGLNGLTTRMGRPSVGHELVTASGSVVLVKERHSFGVAGAAMTGSARIQVGGYPQWRTPERFLRCLVCGRGMRFLASVDSGLSACGRFAFSGTLYGFWCETCDVSCTYRQS